MIWANIHPKCRTHFQMLESNLMRAYMNGETKSLFVPFTGYRAPQAQTALVEAGTSKAHPWESAHNYGMAVDFVPWRGGERNQWTWDDKEDWDFLDRCATQTGLYRPIKWDRPHIEHPLWNVIKKFVL